LLTAKDRSIPVRSSLLYNSKIEGPVTVPVYGPQGQKTRLDRTSKHYVDNELAKGVEGGCLVHSVENTGNNIQVEVRVIFDVFKVESEFLDATSVEKQTLNMLIMNKGSKCLDNRELIFTRL